MSDVAVSLADYDFTFPPELIAQRTAGKGKTKILHVPRSNASALEIRPAASIVDLFNAGDCLVVNNTKVIPARLLGTRSSGGAVEAMLLSPLGNTDTGAMRWEAFVRPGRAFKVGDKVMLGAENQSIQATVESVQENGTRILQFDLPQAEFYAFLNAQGHIPLPPYIDREDDQDDKIAYQTVFAKNEGAVAAPTASLHFSEEMIEQLKAKGVRIAEVTLHVGAGTFQNIQVDDYRNHKMHGERFEISEETVEIIRLTKQNGGRVVSVGTTSTRVLETVANEHGELKAGQGVTYAFIYPGIKFKVIDGLLTNFHWPKSSLVLLVAAFLGKEQTLNAYHYAIENRLQLFSYGDGMLIL